MSVHTNNLYRARLSAQGQFLTALATVSLMPGVNGNLKFNHATSLFEPAWKSTSITSRQP